MYPVGDLSLGSELSDTEYAERARQVIVAGDCAALGNVFVFANRHRVCWEGKAGGLLLADTLNLLLDALEIGDVEAALAGMAACPPDLAARGYDLLHAALFPSGEMEALSEHGDATLLCLALLAGASGRAAEVAPLLERAATGRPADFFGAPAAVIVRHFTPAVELVAFKPKLVIWDLDDTLWQGTLAEGDTPVLDERRAGFVRTLNARGIVSAICSKNDPAVARAALERFGLWDEFVFARIAFVPKGAAVRRLIDDMQLRPQNVLFVDDNPHNLHGVAAAVPGIHVVDARSPECDVLLQKIVDDHAQVAKSRVAGYRLIEAKLAERQDRGLSDEAFLLHSGIEATFTDRMDNLDFVERIAELINRSNQLNYTQSRVAPEVMLQRIQDIDNWEVLAAFVWDRYGYYGLVGAAVYNFRTRTLEHFALSCRVMHMGIEAYLLRMLEERGHRIDAAQLRKALPAQTAQAIVQRSFAEPEVRGRVLAEEAPRDWAKVQLRIMADCQSGAFHHYSRHRAEADFDNNPRLFSLPQMLTGAWRDQHFPRYLAYAAATDYIVWRWATLSDTIDLTLFRDGVDRFVEMVVGGDRRCLLFLPPEGGSLAMYELHVGCDPAWSRAIHPALNAVWRNIAARHPQHFALVELADVLTVEDMVHNHHYVPSALRRIAGLIDDWYEAEQAGTAAFAKAA